MRMSWNTIAAAPYAPERSPSADGTISTVAVHRRIGGSLDDRARRFEQQIAGERDPAADDDAPRRDEVDQTRQPEPEVVPGLLEDADRRLVAFARGFADELRSQRAWCMAGKQAVGVTPDRLVGERQHPLLGGVGFEAAAVAAGIARARSVGLDDDVAHPAGPAEPAGVEPPAGDQPGADPGRNRDVGKIVDAAARAVMRFAECRREGIEREVIGRGQRRGEAAAQVVARPTPARGERSP